MKIVRRIGIVITTFLFILALSFISMPAQVARAAADTCTWTGAVNTNWSNGGNWSGCDNGGVPENDDELVFNSGASGNRSMNNDLAGLTPNSITISDAGYTLNGNALTFVASGNAITATASATINLQVAFNAANSGGSVAPDEVLIFQQPIAFGSAFGQYWTGGGEVQFDGNITGSTGGMLRAENDTRLSVNGASNTFTSSFVGAESNAVFECNSLTCFGDSANRIYMGGGKVDLNVSGVYTNPISTSTVNPEESWLRAYENVTIDSSANIVDPLNIAQFGTGSKSLQFIGSGFTMSGDSSLSLQGNSSANSIIRLNSAVNGSGSINVDNAYVQMNSASNYDGITTIENDGVVSVENATGLGATAAGTVVESGGALEVSGPVMTVAEPISIIGTGTATQSGAIYNSGSADHTLSGAITLTGNATVYNENGAGDLNLDGAIGGTGDLTLLADASAANDPGISVAAGGPNTYSGTTYAAGGAIYFDKTGAVPHNLVVQTAGTPNAVHGTIAYVYGTNAISDTATVTTHTADDTVYFGNNTTPEIVGGLIGVDGRVQVRNNTTVIVDQNFDSVFGGTFYNDGSTSTFVKRGTGKLSLTGSDSFASDNFTYNIEGGILAFNGDFLANSSVNVSPGAALKGTGIIGDVTSSGTVAPGNSPGTINVTNLTLNSSSVFEQEITGATAGSQYDQLIASGAVNLGGATLSLLPTYTPTVGQTFTIIQAASVTGTFNGLPNGTVITENGLRFRINYTSTSVILTYIGNQSQSGNGIVPGAPDTGFGYKGIISSAIVVLIAAILSLLIVSRIKNQKNTLRK